MKIAVNTRLLIKDKLDGIGWFTYETVKRIAQNHPEHNFYFFFDRPFADEFIFSENITPIILKPKARHPVLWYVWFEYSVRRTLKKINADLFLSPDGYLSLGSKVKSIAVIHDINFYRRPKDLPFFSRHYYNRFFPKFAKKSCRIVTVSEYSKSDIMSAYRIKPELIDVVYNGCNTAFHPLSEIIKNEVKLKYTNGKNYFIFIGTMHPRKNIAGLFKSFELFKDETGSDFKLMIVGEKYFMTKDIEKTYANSKYKTDIIFMGRLSPELLHKVLASAFAEIFIPFFEGFGIPIIEAFNCGVPVICSDRTSMPEVAGDAAVLVNPEDIHSVKDAMKRIVEDSDMRNRLIEKAKQRKELFSWDKTAEKLWGTLEKCI